MVYDQPLTIRSSHGGTAYRITYGLRDVEDSTSQAETERFIFKENEHRFQLAADAPISKTKLLNQLGYLADTDIAQQLIEGTFGIPDKLDDATALILEEIGNIGI